MENQQQKMRIQPTKMMETDGTLEDLIIKNGGLPSGKRFTW